MKKFMYLHVGFDKPTPELMQAWHAWFASLSERLLDQAGFAAGKELSADGLRDLAWDRSCLTGYNIIEAESFEEAVALAQGNPFVTALRIYELRSS